MSKVQVRLDCILSGDGESWAPGEVVAVDAEEARRLVGLGVARALDPLDHDGDGKPGGSLPGPRRRSRKSD